MRRYLIILISLIVTNTASAQALISGTVLNAENQEPIQYVSVVLESTFKGTSTDENGVFTLEIPNYSAENIFTFQLVGYKGIELNLVELMQQEKVYLEVDEQEIDEVIVQPINVYDLVQSAMEKIPANYYGNPIGQEVFYRQLLYTNNELSILEEGHYNLLNTFNRKKFPKNISVKKARGVVDMSKYEQLGKIVAKNIVQDSIYVAETAEVLMAYNPNLEELKADKDGIFGENSYKNYDYSYGGMSIKGNHVMHIVNFDQKEGLKKTLYKGTIFIDTASLAVIEVHASLSPTGIDFQKLLPLKVRFLAKLGGYKINIRDIAFDANYSFYEDYWVVKSGEFRIDGSVAKRKGEVLNGNLILSYKVLDNFSKSEFYNINSDYNIIPSDISKFEDPYYWGNLSIIPLPNKAAKLLEQKLKNQ